MIRLCVSAVLFCCAFSAVFAMQPLYAEDYCSLEDVEKSSFSYYNKSKELYENIETLGIELRYFPDADCPHSELASGAIEGHLRERIENSITDASLIEIVPAKEAEVYLSAYISYQDFPSFSEGQKICVLHSSFQFGLAVEGRPPWGGASRRFLADIAGTDYVGFIPAECVGEALDERANVISDLVLSLKRGDPELFSE